MLMADIFDKEKRSAVMRSIRSKGNKSTELALAGIFREQGITGWRRGYPVKGHPDFVFLSKKVAVFADGCFWHGHDCLNSHPKDNEEFWTNKICRNIEHDKKVSTMFEDRGWAVVRIWECELKKKNRPILVEKLKRIFEY